jgi:endoglucanase
MEWGATELYFAVQSCGSSCPINLHLASYYLQQAATWANAYITGPNDAKDTLNLYDVSGLAHFELYRAMALEPAIHLDSPQPRRPCWRISKSIE